MKYQSRSRYQNREGPIHEGDGKRTLCGRLIENTFATKWYEIESEVTCRRCLKK